MPRLLELFVVMFVLLFVFAHTLGGRISPDDNLDEDALTFIGDEEASLELFGDGKKYLLKNVEIYKDKDKGTTKLSFAGGPDSYAKLDGDEGIISLISQGLKNLKKGEKNEITFDEDMNVVKAELSTTKKGKQSRVKLEFGEHVLYTLPRGTKVTYDAKKDPNFMEFKTEDGANVELDVFSSGSESLTVKVSSKEDGDSFKLKVPRTGMFGFFSDRLEDGVTINDGEVFYKTNGELTRRSPEGESDRKLPDFYVMDDFSMEGMDFEIGEKTILDFTNDNMNDAYKRRTEEMDSLYSENSEDEDIAPGGPGAFSLTDGYDESHGPRISLEEKVLEWGEIPKKEEYEGMNTDLFSGAKVGYDLKISQDFEDAPFTINLGEENPIYRGIGEGQEFTITTKGIDKRHASRKLEIYGRGEEPPHVMLSEGARFNIDGLRGERRYSENIGGYDYRFNNKDFLERLKSKELPEVTFGGFSEKVRRYSGLHNDLERPSETYDYDRHIMMKNNLIEGYNWEFPRNNRVLDSGRANVPIKPEKKARVLVESGGRDWSVVAP